MRKLEVVLDNGSLFWLLKQKRLDEMIRTSSNGVSIRNTFDDLEKLN